MKFRSIDEMNQISFDDSGIEELRVQGNLLVAAFSGATIKAGNSQNARYQDMYCARIELRLENVRIARLLKEGLRYYDADGSLLREVPDEDVPAPAQEAVLLRLAKGTVFTTVEDQVEEGYAYEFGIDVPGEDDEEETDTFWLCVLFDRSVASWERYTGPADN